jgi:hypothetical protein
MMGNCRANQAKNVFIQLAFGSLAIAAFGCGASRPATPPSSSPPSAVSEAVAPGQVQLTWYLAAVAGKEAIDDAALQQHFTPEFLAQIPPAKFRAFTEAMRSAAQRLELVRLEPTSAGERVHAITRSATGGLFHVLLAVEPQPAGRITMLLVKPDENPAKPSSVQ